MSMRTKERITPIPPVSYWAMVGLPDLVQVEIVKRPLDDIAYQYAEKAGISVSDMKNTTRHRDTLKHRQACMHFMRLYTAASLSQIARYFGDYHHTTVLHSLKVVSDLSDTDINYRRWLYSVHPLI